MTADWPGGLLYPILARDQSTTLAMAQIYRQNCIRS
jgi:hypothetical protein